MSGSQRQRVCLWSFLFDLIEVGDCHGSYSEPVMNFLTKTNRAPSTTVVKDQSLKGEAWGLQDLYIPESPTMDIVAVHGLNGHPMRSWTSAENICWLVDFLPSEIPGAAVFSYGYPTATPITSAAQELIVALDEKRMTRFSYEVPIVFVAHGTGGLIVKEALVLLASYREKCHTRIFTNTRSLLFFDVPHRGFRKLSMMKILLNSSTSRLVPTYSRGQRGSFLPSAKETTRTLEAFAPISDRFQIFTCRDSIWSIVDDLVDPTTYYLGLPNERVMNIYSTYNDMIKFSSLNADLMKIMSAIRSTITSFGLMLQTRDWASQQVFRLDGIESESSKQWFSDLRSDAHRVVDSRPFLKRSRIAILDTGIDLLHPRFEVAVNEGRVVSKSFVTGLPEDQDRDGHGTHSAHLALLVDPRAKLFVARIFEFGTQKEFEANTLAIANAIRWVVEQRVDIISMSLGYRAEIPEIKVAIRDAFHKGTIIIAAASNSGVNPHYPISFPANMRQVICIHSSDGEGNPSPRNPPATPDCNLAMLGEGVAAAWPRNLETDREDGLRVASGSSVAAPIAAGLASLVIDYASQPGVSHETVTNWRRLKHCDEMRKVFKEMARERAGYFSIAPSSLFDYHGEQMHQRVSGRIGDILDSL